MVDGGWWMVNGEFTTSYLVLKGSYDTLYFAQLPSRPVSQSPSLSVS
jgi:hypothetical protein